MSDAATQELIDGIGRLHQQAGGAFTIRVIRPIDAVMLTAAAIGGDRDAAGMLRGLETSIRQIAAAPRKRPTLCLCCPRPIRKTTGIIFVAVTPYIDRPDEAIFSAICPACAAHPDLHDRIFVAYRNGLWPDLREIAVTDCAGGHA